MKASLEKHSGRIKIRINDELLDPVSFRYFRPGTLLLPASRSGESLLCDICILGLA